MMKGKILSEVFQRWICHALKVQDSSSLSVLNSSNVFIIRRPNAPSKRIGEIVQILKIDF
ncbi:MAG: hypothetical protein CM15mP111_2630 [Hyphomicrobiales bacterium]|nr:MAG: hypothetical protein CM15mP111_2630 [Hyphomicrobiales bacterium]